MDTHSQDSVDFITALTEAEEAGISKDDFLRIWDMEAKLRLLREVEKSKGLKQQEGKLQNSMTSTQGKSNGCKGNHKQPENSTQEVKKSSGLQEVEVKEDITKDLAKDIPQTSRDASTSIDAALIFETFKKNFDQMRKEVAEEMRQVKEELKSLKDTLPERCEKSVHDKLCPEISEKKQELVGLREEVKQWRNEFLELKEAVLALSKKLEEANSVVSSNASVNQKLYDLERRLAVMDNRGISSSSVDAETQTFDDNIKQENTESPAGAETEEVEKSEDVEEKQKEVNKSSREDQLNNGSKPQSRQNKEQQLAQPQVTQGDRSDLQETQQEKQQQQKLAQDKNIQEQQVKVDQVQQQHHQQKQQQGPNSNQVRQLPQQKDIDKTLLNSAMAEKTSLNSEIPIFSKNGTIFEIKDLKERLAEKEPMMISPRYRLPNSSKTVSLCVWFSDERKLNVQLLVFGLDEKPATDNEVYSVTGQIKNRSSGYSWLFEGIKQISKCQGPSLKVNTSVCLETTKGYYENVSLDELKERNYIWDNSLLIRWFVTCKKQV